MFRVFSIQLIGSWRYLGPIYCYRITSSLKYVIGSKKFYIPLALGYDMDEPYSYYTHMILEGSR